MTDYSDLTNRKIQLYFGSNYLFDRGLSHPQVVEILSEHEEDLRLLSSVVDQAQVDLWRKIFNEAQRLLAEGKTYQEVISQVSSVGVDAEIVEFICNTWYNVKALYAENTIESQTNIWEGIQWVVICSIGAILVFYFNASLFSKIIWSIGLLTALITWIYGLKQKRLAKELKKILEEDYSKFDKLI
jgi:hypothetical protein